MQKDERDLLDVLKFELNFLEKGGYSRSSREPWRPVFIFEDSPTCMNYDCKDDPAPCNDCVLMQLVPPELRAGKLPAAKFNSMHQGRRSIHSTGTAMTMRLKKRSKTGCEPRSRNWKCNATLLNRTDTHSRRTPAWRW